MNASNELRYRNVITKLQKESLQHVVKAQEIVLDHLEDAIKERDSATVAAMAEILKT